MSKRKRSETSEARNNATRNPFLKEWESEVESDDQEDEILRHILAFVYLSKEKHQLEDSLIYLLSFLDEKVENGSLEGTGTHSPTEIALLILPWAVKQLLSSSSCLEDSDGQRILVLRSLKTCLEVLLKVDDRSREAKIRMVLSQSTLFKLVPKLALFAIGSVPELESDSDEQTSSFEDEAASKSIDNSRNLAVVAHVLLVDKLFRPTVDVACKSLLLPIVASMHLEDQYARVLVLAESRDHDSLDQKHCKILLLSTLRLICFLKDNRGGNPKTTFQLFASKPLILAFSRVYFFLQNEGFDGLMLSDVQFFEDDNAGQACIREILYDGLFNPRHHMEGFRSLLLRPSTDDVDEPSESPSLKKNESSSSFQCYQEVLLNVILECLANFEFDDNYRAADVRDAAFIAPILFRGFLEQTEEWDRERREAGGNKKIRGGDIAVVQFRMFIHLTAPLRRLISRESSAGRISTLAMAFRSLRESLRLLLDHDAYVVSQDKEGDKQYAFLESITSEILSLHLTTDDFPGLELLSDSIHLLRILVKLNHKLLHERIADAMYLCLSCADGRLQPHIVDFLVTVFDTYRRLREQNHLFRSIFEVLMRFENNGTEKSLELVSLLLRDHVLPSEVARAVQDAPILQMKAVFETIATWIRGICRRPDEGSTIPRNSLDIVARFTVIIIRNIQVGSGTASGVSLMCEGFMAGCVQELVSTAVKNADSMNTDLMKPALTLCGWLIDLHGRCGFWLGESSYLAMPSEVKEVLTAASQALQNRSAVRKTVDFEAILYELLFLAGHRLQQLRSLVHDQERMELEASALGISSVASIAEAEKLASFMAEAAKRPRHQSCGSWRSPWTLIARVFAYWAPYAKDSDIESFLNWMFSVLAIDPVSPSLPVESYAYRPDYQGIQEEIEIAKVLLSDASFFENPNVSARLGLVALSCTADWIGWALSRYKTGDPHLDKQLCAHVVPCIGGAPWARSTPQRLLDLFCFDVSFRDSAIADNDVEFVISVLDQAACPLVTINGMSRTIQSVENAFDYVDLAFRLELVCRSFVYEEEIQDAMLLNSLRLIGILRLSVAKVMDSLPDESFLDFFGDGGDIFDVLKAVIQTTRALVNLAGAFRDASYTETLFSGTGALVKALVKRAFCGARVSHHRTLEECLLLERGEPRLERDELEKITVEQPKMFTHDMDINEIEQAAEVRVLCFLGRFVLEGIEVAWPELSSAVKEETYIEFLSAIRDTLFKAVIAAEVFDALYSVKSEVFVPRHLLFGDLLRLSVTWNLLPWPRSEIRDVLTRKAIASPKWIDTCSKVGSATSYIVASLTRTNLAQDMADEIMARIMGSQKKLSGLLTATFCELMRSFHGPRLDGVMVKLTKEDVSLPIESRLDLAGLLVRNLEDEDQLETFAGYSRKIFELALKQLYTQVGNEETWAEHVVKACSLISQLVQRKIVSFKERDLALILSHICSVLAPPVWEDGGSDDALLVLADTVYSATVSLFTTLFQRYTKQLYACAPVVISVLQALFCRVLYGPLPDETVIDRGHKFTRLAEMLTHHKEIYKKHLLGLLLEFVHALQDDMSLLRKQNLLPAVYCLLDSLTSYETKQLNNMMDTQAKALFRTVYQNYQRLHAYRGQ